MGVIIGLSVVMGLLFGLATFIIIVLIDGISLAVPMGIGAGILFGLLLAGYMAIHSRITQKKYLKYRMSNINEPIIFEDTLFRLNGNAKDAGHLFLTKEAVIIVMLKGKKVLSEIKIPLETIASIEKRNDYGHLQNALIVQKDGTETRFISDYKKLFKNLFLIIGYQICDDEIDQGRCPLDNKTAFVQEYLDQIEAPSKVFQTFLSHYFIGHPMIRGRGEEDQTVWGKLIGKELEVAVQMVLDNLGHDSAYIRAVGIFRDERAIPMLKDLVESLSSEFCYERLLSARVLYDWTGYEKYLSVLAETLPNSGEYTKTSLSYWISGLDKEIAIQYIFMMLQDKSSFVRWCAYSTLLDYFKLSKQKYEEIKYYTDDKVYADHNLFHKRLEALKEKVEML